MDPAAPQSPMFVYCIDGLFGSSKVPRDVIGMLRTQKSTRLTKNGCATREMENGRVGTYTVYLLFF